MNSTFLKVASVLIGFVIILLNLFFWTPAILEWIGGDLSPLYLGHVLNFFLGVLSVTLLLKSQGKKSRWRKVSFWLGGTALVSMVLSASIAFIEFNRALRWVLITTSLLFSASVGGFLTIKAHALAESEDRSPYVQQILSDAFFKALSPWLLHFVKGIVLLTWIVGLMTLAIYIMAKEVHPKEIFDQAFKVLSSPEKLVKLASFSTSESDDRGLNPEELLEKEYSDYEIRSAIEGVLDAYSTHWADLDKIGEKYNRIFFKRPKEPISEKIDLESRQSEKFSARSELTPIRIPNAQSFFDKIEPFLIEEKNEVFRQIREKIKKPKREVDDSTIKLEVYSNGREKITVTGDKINKKHLKNRGIPKEELEHSGPFSKESLEKLDLPKAELTEILSRPYPSYSNESRNWFFLRSEDQEGKFDVLENLRVVYESPATYAPKQNEWIQTQYRMLFGKVERKLKAMTQVLARGDLSANQILTPLFIDKNGSDGSKFPAEVEAWINQKRKAADNDDKRRQLFETFLLLIVLGALGSLIFLTRDYMIENWRHDEDSINEDGNTEDRERPLTAYLFRPILGIFLALAMFVIDLVAHVVVSSSTILDIRHETLYVLALAGGLISEKAYEVIQYHAHKALDRLMEDAESNGNSASTQDAEISDES